LAEIVNLRMARKQQARRSKEEAAAENRALHSIPGRERRRAEANRELEERRHEANRREPGNDENR
jgi:hypothetical protein